MGRRRAGLVIALLLVSARGSGASSFYVARRVLEALILDDVVFIFQIFFYLELYFVEIIYVIDSSYVDDMAFVEMYLISAVTFIMRYFSCMIAW